MMWKKILLSILIIALQGQLCLTKQTGCPPAEDIYPCKCTTLRSKKGILKCIHLSDESLRNVIENLKEYRFNEVILENSNFEYLPSNLFEDVEMRILSLDDLKLTKVFNRQPRNNRKPEVLTIKKVEVENGSVWEMLEPLKNLKELNVIQIPIKTVGKDFSQYVTENLSSLYFNDTDTETIEPGTFDKFTNLQTLAFLKGSIKSLEREMFPTPFNAYYIAFDYQKLTKIPEGLFKDMPELRYVSLISNNLATIPEEAFDRYYHLYYLYLNDNPIKCDCRIKWIVYKRVPVPGSCASPKMLQGRKIKDLSISYFHKC